MSKSSASTGLSFPHILLATSPLLRHVLAFIVRFRLSISIQSQPEKSLTLLRMHAGSLSLLLSLYIGIASTLLLLPTSSFNASENGLNRTAGGIFEQNVNAGFDLIKGRYPRIRIWGAQAFSPRGPTINPLTFTRVSVFAYQRNIDTLVEIENGAHTRTGWSDLSTIESERLNIQTWAWGERRIPFGDAFHILERDMKAPVTKALLWRFRNGPEWGPRGQEYYAFFVDNDVDHAWWVGGTDGMIYGPQNIDPSDVPDWVGMNSTVI